MTYICKLLLIGDYDSKIINIRVTKLILDRLPFIIA
jgi:hypothetical protein